MKRARSATAAPRPWCARFLRAREARSLLSTGRRPHPRSSLMEGVVGARHRLCPLGRDVRRHPRDGRGHPAAARGRRALRDRRRRDARLPRRARAPRARRASQPRRRGPRRPAAAGRRQRPRDRRRARRARRPRRAAHRLGAAVAGAHALDRRRRARQPRDARRRRGRVLRPGAAAAPGQPARRGDGDRRAARPRRRALVGHGLVPLAPPEHAVRPARVDRVADGRRRRRAARGRAGGRRGRRPAPRRRVGEVAAGVRLPGRRGLVGGVHRLRVAAAERPDLEGRHLRLRQPAGRRPGGLGAAQRGAQRGHAGGRGAHRRFGGDDRQARVCARRRGARARAGADAAAPTIRVASRNPLP